MDVARAGLQGALLGSPGGPVGAGISGLGAAAETAFPGAGPQDIQQGMIPTAKNLKEFLARIASNLEAITLRGSLAEQPNTIRPREVRGTTIPDELIDNTPPSTYFKNDSVQDPTRNNLPLRDPRTVALAYMRARYPNRMELPSSYKYSDLPPKEFTEYHIPGMDDAAAFYSPHIDHVVSSTWGKNSTRDSVDILAHETQHARQWHQAWNNGKPRPTMLDKEAPATKAEQTAEQGLNKFLEMFHNNYPEVPNKLGAVVDFIMQQHRPQR
jgi:hypothetical protein